MDLWSQLVEVKFINFKSKGEGLIKIMDALKGKQLY